MKTSRRMRRLISDFVSGAAAAADFDINRGSGKLTVTIADRMGAYVIFGQCTAAGATAQ